MIVCLGILVPVAVVALLAVAAIAATAAVGVVLNPLEATVPLAVLGLGLGLGLGLVLVSSSIHWKRRSHSQCWDDGGGGGYLGLFIVSCVEFCSSGGVLG